MLGLGLSITSVSGLRSLASKLLGILRSRSTYSENNVSSNATIDAIDNAGVLDDATILLTPTAYSNARVHSVKTYTGDDYVVGGDFSDFSTDWITNTATESGGVVTIPDGGYIFQNISFPNDGTVRIRVEGSGTVKYRLGVSSPSDTFITKTLPFTAYEDLNSTDARMQLNNTSGSDITVTKISVVNVSSDFDFDRASSATRINSDGLVQDMQSITDVELVQNGDFEELGDEVYDDDITAAINGGTWVDNGDGTFTVTGDGSPNEGIGVRDAYADYLTNGKTYKWTVEGDNVTLALYDNSYALVASGTSPLYFTATATNRLYISPSDGGRATYSNVSIKQVDPNDRWTVTDSDANNYVEFTEGFARLKFLNTSPVTNFKTSNSILQGGQTYKLVVDVHDVTSGGIKIDGSGISETFNTEGVTTRYITPTGSTALTFYRATANVDITLASVSVKDITFADDVDLARINYDSNGDNGHILLEPTSTNLITYSEDLTQLYWTTTSLDVETSLVTAPDGSSYANKLVPDDGIGGFKGLSRLFNSLSGLHTVSFFAKKGEYNYIMLRTRNSPNTGVMFNLDNGTFSINIDNDILVDNSIYMTALPNDWYRCELTLDPSEATVVGQLNLGWNVGITGNEQNSFSGDGVSGVYLWGVQFEALSYATSYIPTLTGSTVTRATETLNGSGNSTLINSTEGVLYFEGSSLIELGGVNRHITISNGSSSNRLYFYHDTNGKFGFASFVNGALQANITYDGIIAENSKVACKYKENDYAMWINGVERGTDTSASVWSSGTFDRVNFAGTSASNNPFYGKVKALAVFDKALTDTELEDLTS